MKRAKLRKLILEAVLLMAWLLPLGVLGQDGSFTHQSFGNSVEGGFTHQSFGNSVDGGFTHQTFGNGIGGGFTHQGFGNDVGGGFTHQPFGNDAPLGGGLVVLFAAGLGYAAMKRKKQQINKEK